MMEARSVRVIVRCMTSGGGAAGGTIAARCDTALDEPGRIDRRRVRGPGSGQTGGARRPGLAAEQADPQERAIGQALPGVAVRAVEEEPGAQLGLGIGALVRERGRVGTSSAAAAWRGS